ncbi:hypothetical protein FHL15_006390 [Xylaria flabelliformis]|uniref:PNPLA domain-containing protein n=1 Tax=Xylaria flabelliformis TaxID=2512241 RepID=A0A553HXP2_9PEZI|nr:hypothetical protein FHL15_006390 [Xylaria flabelliformis]
MDDHAIIPSSTNYPHAGRDNHNETFGPWVQKIGLSLGGIRGYWSLLVLGELMKLIKVEEENRDGPTRSSFHPYDEPRNVFRTSQALETPFLPCHYFDYVAGTSTGALITILLSRFRMTVDDCLREYEAMASSVFGHPKLLYSMKFGVGGNKFRRASLEQAIKKVIERRAEQRTEDYSEFLFQTEIDTCRGVVLAMRVGDRQTNSQPFLFRSYTPFNERSGQHRARHTGEPKNHLEGSKISLAKVALAATAAPLYFGDYRCTLSAAQMQASKRVPTTLGTTISSTQRHASSRISTARGVMTSSTKRNDMMPADGKAEYEFEDAGFGAVNNPCSELAREIMHHHGQIEPILRLDTVGRYFRFNDEQGIDIEMDDWRPKNSGKQTLEALGNGFREWVLRAEVRKDLMDCAKTLVDYRRARMTTPRWERFALVRSFECRVNMCPKDRDNKWLDREDFKNHLARDHKPEDYKGTTIDEAVERCAREWEYRA